MAAKITWKSCACRETLQLSDTGMPSVPTVMATHPQLLWGELVSSQGFAGNLNNDNTQKVNHRDLMVRTSGWKFVTSGCALSPGATGAIPHLATPPGTLVSSWSILALRLQAETMTREEVLCSFGGCSWALLYVKQLHWGTTCFKVNFFVKPALKREKSFSHLSWELYLHFCRSY